MSDARAGLWEAGAVLELDLVCVSEASGLYELEGVGWLGFDDGGTRSATATAGGSTWHLTAHGAWRQRYVAAPEDGAVDGFMARRRSATRGTLQWHADALTATSFGPRRRQLQLTQHGELVIDVALVADPVRPIHLQTRDEPVAPGLLLFAAFVARQIAKPGRRSDAAGSAAAAGSGPGVVLSDGFGGCGCGGGDGSSGGGGSGCGGGCGGGD